MIYPRERPTNISSNKLLYHLYFDTMADFNELPGLEKAAPGSDAYCIDTQDIYILSAATSAWEVQ